MLVKLILLAVVAAVAVVVSLPVAEILAGVLVLAIVWLPVDPVAGEEASSYERVIPTLLALVLLIAGLDELGILRDTFGAWLPFVSMAALLVALLVAIYMLRLEVRRDQPESPGQ